MYLFVKYIFAYCFFFLRIFKKKSSFLFLKIYTFIYYILYILYRKVNNFEIIFKKLDINIIKISD